MSGGNRGAGTPTGTGRSERRITLLVGLASLLLFLPLQHGHFKGTDELAVYEMTRSLCERGDLAVPAIRHTEVGRGGRRYSYFAPGQAVLAAPLYLLADPLRALLPAKAIRALAGPENRRGLHVYGGELERTLVGLFAPLASALLVMLFYAFERRLGIARTTAVGLALLLAISTHTAVMSTYFLRHTTVTSMLLGALLLFRRFARDGSLAALLAGSALASSIVLVRVPAGVVAPALGGYLLWALHRRGELHRGVRRLLPILAAILLPLGVAILCHVLVAEAKWGTWIASPMLDQQSRMNSPLWRGLVGLLLSPGSSVFVYSPLLLLAPAGLRVLWRRERAECATLLALTATLLVFYARFDGWSGLWSAPGPRYLYPLVPLLLLPLGLWLDELSRRAGRRARAWTLVGALAAVGVWVQLVSIAVRWGSVPNLAGYPILGPDQADFLFQLSRSPVVVMSALLLEGGPIDSWLWTLREGWPGFAASPRAVGILSLVWAAAAVGCGVWLVRELRSPAEGQR